MSSVIHLKFKDKATFLSSCRYALVYIYRKSDTKSKDLDKRIRRSSEKYPSVVIRFLDYYDLISNDEYLDRTRNVMLTIYYRGKNLTSYYDPSEIFILKILHTIHFGITPSNFRVYVKTIDDEEIRTLVLPETARQKLEKRSTYINEKKLVHCEKQNSTYIEIDPKLINREQYEIYKAASILCSFKNPDFKPIKPLSQNKTGPFLLKPYVNPKTNSCLHKRVKKYSFNKEILKY